MNSFPPYGPDRSLLLAVGVLTGALLICAGGAYVISSLSVGSGSGGVTDAARPAPAPSGSVVEGARSRDGSSSIAGGRVPAWAGSGRQSVPSGPSAPQGRYDINPDLGHAQLGSPSGLPGGGPGAAVADAGTPTGDGLPGEALGAGTGASAPDLSGKSFDEAATGGGAPQWRSEAEALASRSRALSSQLGHLDREGGREASSSRSENAEGEPSGEATTASGSGASTSSPPGTPEEPNQVPLGGAEWLAAVGAAYAANRLRRRSAMDDDEE